MTLLVSTPLTLAQQPSRERETMRRFQQQIAKLQQDNAQLQHDKTELEAKLKTAQSERDKLNAQGGRLRKAEAAAQSAHNDNSRLRAELTGGEQKLRDTQQRCQQQLTELRAQLEQARTELSQAVRGGEQQVGALRSSVQQQQSRAELCERKNQQLYSVTMDLIARYKGNRGAWEKFLLSEPFTGLKSVEVENLLEDMRQRARAAQVDSSRITPQSGSR